MNDFILGSTVAFYPLVYLGRAYSKLSCKEMKDIDLFSIYYLLPIVYGLTYVLLKKRIKNLFVLGAVAGLIYSLIGRFLLNLPSRLFKMRNPNHVHIYAMVMYSLIYGILIKRIK